MKVITFGIAALSRKIKITKRIVRILTLKLTLRAISSSELGLKRIEFTVNITIDILLKA